MNVVPLIHFHSHNSKFNTESYKDFVSFSFVFFKMMLESRWMVKWATGAYGFWLLLALYLDLGFQLFLRLFYGQSQSVMPKLLVLIIIIDFKCWNCPDFEKEILVAPKNQIFCNTNLIRGTINLWHFHWIKIYLCHKRTSHFCLSQTFWIIYYMDENYNNVIHNLEGLYTKMHVG